jgi:hypothetical protein
MVGRYLLCHITSLIQLFAINRLLLYAAVLGKWPVEKHTKNFSSHKSHSMTFFLYLGQNNHLGIQGNVLQFMCKCQDNNEITSLGDVSQKDYVARGYWV